jgi:RNA polymerase sigma factor (sigma-70 family)
MNRLPLSQVLDDLKRSIGHPDAHAGDARLLELFIRQGDGHAFAALLNRHGPMVLGVCKRILGNLDDAEDAFQATFLVLVRKARTLRTGATVGNWLYGVAHRTALEARRAMAKRRAKETQVRPRAAPTEPGTADDLRSVLDLELARLPDRYRQVIVLCDLEGERRKEVARRLGCPEGTVASRLAKARTLLAARLARHGLVVSAGALAAALAAETASAAVPPAWLPLTIQAARQIASGSAATAGALSAPVAFLMEGVCRTMFVKKLKTIGGILLLLALIGSGAGTLYFHSATAAEPGDALPGVAAQGPAQPKDAELRQEITRLKQDLETVMKKAVALETRLAEIERERPEILFRSKPASFWKKQLRDRDAKYRSEAVTALGGIAEVDHALIPTVLTTLRDKDHEVRNVAALALVNVGEPALRHLITALKDPSQEHRTWVMHAISRFGADGRAAVPALIGLVKEGKKTDGLVAVATLRSIGPDAAAAVPSLVELLKDRSKMECYVAASALGWIGPSAKEAVPLLIDLLKDTAVRKFAFDPSLLPVFTGSDYEYIPAVSAAQALGEIGPDAKAALPALGAAAADPRLEAPIREAIRRIDPAASKKN